MIYLINDAEQNEDTLVSNINDWEFEDRLSKELATGFFILDHPINQYKEIFNDYKIIDHKNFLANDSINKNVAELY